MAWLTFQKDAKIQNNLVKFFIAPGITLKDTMRERGMGVYAERTKKKKKKDEKDEKEEKKL